MSTTTSTDTTTANKVPEYDVIFVGAGFGSITTFHRYVPFSLVPSSFATLQHTCIFREREVIGGDGWRAETNADVRLRKLGLRCRIFEREWRSGGVWVPNNYPGEF